MKLTNNLNLPEPLYDAVKNDGYSRGDADISVTGLLGPARKRALEIKHWDELEEDASSRIWSLFGQAIHTILERANKTGIAERRLSITVDGWKISGGMDLVSKDGTLTDYKTATVWKFLDGKVPVEFEQQLNIYGEILRQNGEAVTKLEIVGLLKDWSKMQLLQNDGYPQTAVIVRNVPLWTSEKVMSLIRERVGAHKAALLSLPECTPEERWQKDTIYAVHKEGKKSAERLYKNETDAKTHAMQSDKLYVSVRPGESVRCAQYCSVNKFCTQYQREINK